jgi:CRISPR-associated endonuclease/helicase Cas3
MKITTLPVYSKLADERDIPVELREKLPLGWKLSQHQLDTYQALVSDDYDVIFNTAMTGDGKSLAGQLAAIVHSGIEYPVLAMYPTNELIADQQVHLEQTIAGWKPDILPKALNSSKLDQIMEEDDYSRRGDALMRILRNGDFVLSNPDIFHYVMHQFYTFPDDAPDRYSAPLTQKFRQLTFDEFHIFDAPQIVSVLNAILFMREIGGAARKHKFLFLSATPKDLMLNYLRNSGLEVHEIRGEYASDGEQTHWRKILNPTDINFESEPRAENWIEAHVDDILLPFFLQRRPHAKGAIIVNSVASAQRIYDKLMPIFAQHGLKVEQNTGLTGRSRRKISYDADLLVGTSTVDVGVDFQINFLVFESRDAGSFLQRLGRLGRHDCYWRGGQKYPFYDFAAYALLPDWVVSRLFNGQGSETPWLEENSEIDRLRLNKAVQNIFPPAVEFGQYANRWGKYQSVKLLWGLSRKTIREQYRDARDNLRQQYEDTFGTRMGKAIAEYKELAKPLLDEALSFRGGNQFPCCVIDLSELEAHEQFKIVDLVQMISNYSLSYLSAEDFYAAARQVGLNPRVFEKQEPLGFFRLNGIEEFQKILFVLDRDLSYWGAERYGKAQVLKGFRLDARFPGAAEINNRLSRREMPTLLCAGMKPWDLKKRLSLPMLFPLFEFISRDGLNGTAAFGRAALMLDSRLYFSSINGGGGAVIA